MDIPRIVEEATRAAAAAGVAPADPKIGQLVEKRIEQQLAANQASLTRMAETLTREAASRADRSRVRSTCRAATSKSRCRRTGASSAARTRCSTWIAR